MVTSFYIMSMSKHKNNIDVQKYYNDLNNQNYSNLNNISTKCRICLQEARTSINYEENTIDIQNFLQVFVNIEINQEDIYPKKLCNTCLKFIQSAILFQKIAKRNNDLLKQTIKEESFTDEQDSFNYDEGSDIKPTSPELSEEKVKPLKEPKVKISTKVQCNVCNKIINRSYYKEHMTMHDPDHHKYICDVCGRSFRLRCAYHNHSLRHRKDFPYKCTFCPYKARYSELLKTHLRIHTGDYRYMCTECPARFLFKSNLNSHMFKHKEPQHKCETCNRAFHTKISLQKHIDADHLGIKNHVCNICGKAFGYRNAMTKHQRHVHKREKLHFSRMPTYMQAEPKTYNIV